MSKFLSCDSPKAVKANGFGYLNGILYMAPASTSGVNLCSHASAACINLCLGWFSGQAGMVSNLDLDMNDTRDSRVRKARDFMRNRHEFLQTLLVEITKVVVKAHREDLKPCIRLNGSTDIAWEGIRVIVTERTAIRCNALLKRNGLPETVTAGPTANVFAVFPDVQFVDYTKNPGRFRRALPLNYHLTFSRSETNERDAADVLGLGHNVAVVFDRLPASYLGKPVIDGDRHDLRHLDPRNVVVGLTPKGRLAKKDTSGFVVRNAA